MADDTNAQSDSVGTDIPFSSPSTEYSVDPDTGKVRVVIRPNRITSNVESVGNSKLQAIKYNRPDVDLTPVDHDPFATTASNVSAIAKQNDTNPLDIIGSSLNKLFGVGEERFQTWPEKMIRSGLSLPGDVMSGQQPLPSSVDPQTGLTIFPNSVPFDSPEGKEALGRVQDMAGLAALSGPPMALKGTAGVFGGRLAQTHDPIKLQEAEGLLKSGVTPNEIWDKTGQFQGADNIWRYEISDNEAKLLNQNIESTFHDQVNEKGDFLYGPKLSEILDHPKLFEAYPQLKDIRVDTNVSNNQLGVARFDGSIGLKAGMQPDQMKAVLLHEVQHHIQNIEGTAKGGNPQQFELGPDEIRELKEQHSALSDAIAAKVMSLKGMNINDALKLIQVQKGPIFDLKTIALAQSEMPRLLRMHKQISEMLNDTSGFDRYQKLAGEVESRNVERRSSGIWSDLPPFNTEGTPRAQQIIKGVGKQYKLTPVESDPFSGVSSVQKPAPWWTEEAGAKAFADRQKFDQDIAEKIADSKQAYENSLKQNFPVPNQNTNVLPTIPFNSRQDIVNYINTIKNDPNKLDETKSVKGFLKFYDEMYAKPEEFPGNKKPPTQIEDWKQPNQDDLIWQRQQDLANQVRANFDRDKRMMTANIQKQYEDMFGTGEKLPTNYQSREQIISDANKYKDVPAYKDRYDSINRFLKFYDTAFPHDKIIDEAKPVVAEKSIMDRSRLGELPNAPKYPMMFSSGIQLTPVDHHPFVNNSNNVPYGAGASDTDSGYPVNIDKSIPQYNPKLLDKTGKPADLWKYLSIHEIEEHKAMLQGTSYLKAHHNIATPAEKAAVEADGVNWNEYEKIMDGYLKHTEHEDYTDTPPNLYEDPYPHQKQLLLDKAKDPSYLNKSALDSLGGHK